MLAILLAASCSWLFLRAMIPQLSRLLLDQPNPRSSRIRPTPRGGGIAFVVVACVSSATALLSGQNLDGAVIPLLATPLAIVGLLDDRFNLPSSWRYIAQLFVAALMLAFSPLVKGLIPALIAGNWFILIALALLMITVTAVINFTNLWTV